MAALLIFICDNERMLQQPRQRFLLHVILCGSYMSERMVIRAKELQVEKAAMEEAMARDEALRCSGMFHAAVF
jgi:ATP-dependent protease ClpP protease subunit